MEFIKNDKLTDLVVELEPVVDLNILLDEFNIPRRCCPNEILYTSDSLFLIWHLKEPIDINFPYIRSFLSNLIEALISFNEIDITFFRKNDFIPLTKILYSTKTFRTFSSSPYAIDEFLSMFKNSPHTSSFYVFLKEFWKHYQFHTKFKEHCQQIPTPQIKQNIWKVLKGYKEKEFIDWLNGKTRPNFDKSFTKFHYKLIKLLYFENFKPEDIVSFMYHHEKQFFSIDYYINILLDLGIIERPIKYNLDKVKQARKQLKNILGVDIVRIEFTPPMYTSKVKESGMVYYANGRVYPFASLEKFSQINFYKALMMNAGADDTAIEPIKTSTIRDNIETIMGSIKALIVAPAYNILHNEIIILLYRYLNLHLHRCVDPNNIYRIKRTNEPLIISKELTKLFKKKDPSDTNIDFILKAKVKLALTAKVVINVVHFSNYLKTAFSKNYNLTTIRQVLLETPQSLYKFNDIDHCELVFLDSLFSREMFEACFNDNKLKSIKPITR